jgi:teichoic acid transport system permease protein
VLIHTPIVLVGRGTRRSGRYDRVVPESPAAVDPDLFDVHRTAKLGPYLRDLWARRSYVLYVASSELRARQVNTILGNLWHLLNPAMTIGVFYLIFGRLLKVNRGVDNFILFLTIGVFVFQFTQRSITQGANSLVSNMGLIRAFRFPRVTLPVTSVVTEACAALPSFLVMYAVAILTGQSLRWQWVLVPLLFALQFWFNIAAAMIAARATTHFRDLTQILPFVFRLLLYGSGVIFNVTAYADGPHAIWFDLNPIYCLLTMTRWSVMGSEAEIVHLVSLTGWTVVLLIAGLSWFRAAEDRYGRE